MNLFKAWKARRHPSSGAWVPEREQVRLHLVSLACEVAVLAALIDEDLTPVSRQAAAHDLKLACWEHRRLALELLSTDTHLHALSMPCLRQAQELFRLRLLEVRSLRARMGQLLSTLPA